MKQTLMLKQKKEMDSDILKSAPTSCSYVDDKFFEKNMGEVKDDVFALTYSVNIWCVKADWIINTYDPDFLSELLKQENRELILTPYVKLIIDYLYGQYSSEIKKMIFPYAIHIVTTFIMIGASEALRAHNDGIN